MNLYENKVKLKRNEYKLNRNYAVESESIVNDVDPTVLSVFVICCCRFCCDVDFIFFFSYTVYFFQILIIGERNRSNTSVRAPCVKYKADARQFTNMIHIC